MLCHANLYGQTSIIASKLAAFLASQQAKTPVVPQVDTSTILADTMYSLITNHHYQVTADELLGWLHNLDNSRHAEQIWRLCKKTVTVNQSLFGYQHMDVLATKLTMQTDRWSRQMLLSIPVLDTSSTTSIVGYVVQALQRKMYRVEYVHDMLTRWLAVEHMQHRFVQQNGLLWLSSILAEKLTSSDYQQALDLACKLDYSTNSTNCTNSNKPCKPCQMLQVGRLAGTVTRLVAIPECSCAQLDVLAAKLADIPDELPAKRMRFK
jgi:hypothetical protein